MDSSGIEVRLDELGRHAVLARTKSEIAQKLTNAYAETSEYKDLLGSIKIEQDTLREAVMHKLVDEIISNWARAVEK